MECIQFHRSTLSAPGYYQEALRYYNENVSTLSILLFAISQFIIIISSKQITNTGRLVRIYRNVRRNMRCNIISARGSKLISMPRINRIIFIKIFRRLFILAQIYIYIGVITNKTDLIAANIKKLLKIYETKIIVDEHKFLLKIIHIIFITFCNLAYFLLPTSAPILFIYLFFNIQILLSRRGSMYNDSRYKYIEPQITVIIICSIIGEQIHADIMHIRKRIDARV